MNIQDSICIHDGCDKPKSKGKSGFCAAHYDRHRKGTAMDNLCVECRAIVGTRSRRKYCPKCMVKPCKHDGCDKPRYRASGLCVTHWCRHNAGKAMDRFCVECEAIIPAGTVNSNVRRCPKCMVKPCKHDGCDEPRYGARDLCLTHWGRRRTGRAMDRKPIPIGATRTDPDGYVREKVSDKGRWPLQHRVVMEKRLKRPLEKYETVHHKNTVKHDNDVNNLELWSHGQPPGGRVKDRISYFVEQISLYADLADQADLLGICDRTIARLP